MQVSELYPYADVAVKACIATIAFVYVRRIVRALEALLGLAAEPVAPPMPAKSIPAPVVDMTRTNIHIPEILRSFDE